jgi:hypothetical protein
MPLDAVMRIASMTKTVTSVAAMQLVEQGRIGLDDTLGDSVPELAAVQVLEGFGDDGVERIVECHRAEDAFPQLDLWQRCRCNPLAGAPTRPGRGRPR